MLASIAFVGGVAGLTWHGRQMHDDDGSAGFPHGYFGQVGRIGPTLDWGLNKIHHPDATDGAPVYNYHAGEKMPPWAARVYRQNRINHTARSTHWSSNQARTADYTQRPLNVTSARRFGLGTTASQFVMNEKDRYKDMHAYYGGKENREYWDPRNKRGTPFLHNVAIHEFQNS